MDKWRNGFRNSVLSAVGARRIEATALRPGTMLGKEKMEGDIFKNALEIARRKN